MSSPVATWEELREMSELIADAIVKRTNPAGDDISRSQAEKLYGANWLRSQEAAGRVRGYRSGTGTNSKIVYSRHDLDCIRASERRRARLILEHK